ncbi:glycosyl transferase [Neptunitalea chrysea]|uniref:Glycosyl transferase n=1 Tax=Neptunitalea chrysea TaxID=1647581 RepID=A0A9W6B3M0_9FLAO|nr:glycosyl transferase [Neptunitalea chrysea]
MLLIFIASFDTKGTGLFFQKRVGLNGQSFVIYKIRTMSVKDDSISRFGSFLRTLKIDELPQFLNVLMGTMSIVGPRPDVIGFADALIGDDRKVLEVKPGITSDASIKYFNEEELLRGKVNLDYVDRIWQDKVKLNKEYVENWTFKRDLKIILTTIKLILKR